MIVTNFYNVRDTSLTTGKSCRLRWFNQLDPRINKRAFTEEEEFRLLAAHRAYGNKWALISRLFPGRTDNAVKNHWHVIMARRTRESQRQRQQPPPTLSRDAEMTVSSSCRYNQGKFINEEDDDDDVSAVSTCTTELSLTPPSSAYQPRFFNYDSTLASGNILFICLNIMFTMFFFFSIENILFS